MLDVLCLPIAASAAIAMKFIRRIGIGRLPRTLAAFRKLGIYPIRNHYYEPLFDARELKHSLDEDRALPALNLNIDEQLDLIGKFAYADELLDIPMDRESQLGFYYNNGFFEAGDAEFLYNIIRHAKPRRIFEIGSGHSTMMARIALAANNADDANYQCHHVCVEPYEAGWLDDVGVDLVRTPVERIDPGFFTQLEPNDVLFIDSSHMIRPQGDVLFEYLRILPALNSGVLVHIHDIRTPKDYPSSWITKEVRFWNEQYLLEAFLSFNSEFKIIGAVNHLKHHYPHDLARCCPVLGKYIDDVEPGSFWIQRV